MKILLLLCFALPLLVVAEEDNATLLVLMNPAAQVHPISWEDTINWSEIGQADGIPKLTEPRVWPRPIGSEDSGSYSDDVSAADGFDLSDSLVADSSGEAFVVLPIIVLKMTRYILSADFAVDMNRIMESKPMKALAAAIANRFNISVKGEVSKVIAIGGKSVAKATHIVSKWKPTSSDLVFGLSLAGSLAINFGGGQLVKAMKEEAVTKKGSKLATKILKSKPVQRIANKLEKIYNK